MKAITVENIGKYYPRYHKKANSLRDWLSQKPWQASPKEVFWALKDVSFSLEAGSKLGIIGKNGAGKSTLLKILSQITEPSTGRVEINGRVHSLLEVGTGFHPDLSGRENVFLNGTLLGMKRAEIRSKFDEIVDFSGVSEFIDTPVKHYSSGMYLRLAFAVAAHLESEILLVDEVLAVGDYEFQKKCLGKMNEVAEAGKTVVFVSHNLQAISTLTEKAILLSEGKLIDYDSSDEVIKKYIEGLNIEKHSGHYINSKSKLTKPYIREIKVHTNLPNNIQNIQKSLCFTFYIFTPYRIVSPALSYQIMNQQDIPVIHILNLNEEISFCQEKGLFALKSTIPNCRLYPGQYYLKVHFADKKSKEKYETLEFVCHFEVKVIGEMRDFYWYKNHAVYLEDNYWEIA